MKIVRNLQHLEHNATWAIKRSCRLLASVSSTTNAFAKEERMTYAVINILNSWSNFQRTYFICCLLGAKSATQGFVTSSQTGLVMNANDAIGKAIVHFTPKKTPLSNGTWDTRDEPAWHNSNTLLKLATAYIFSNESQIQTTFSLGFTAHNNLVVFRNYYAHKNRGTKSKAQAIAVQYLLQQRQHPTAILLGIPFSSPSINLIGLWADELCQTIEWLCA
jgi:hypothetical protein